LSALHTSTRKTRAVNKRARKGRRTLVRVRFIKRQNQPEGAIFERRVSCENFECGLFARSSVVLFFLSNEAWMGRGFEEGGAGSRIRGVYVLCMGRWREGVRLTGTKDDGVPDHDVIGTRGAADSAGRIGRKTLEVPDQSSPGCGRLHTHWNTKKVTTGSAHPIVQQALTGTAFRCFDVQENAYHCQVYLDGAIEV
jgi:hypothetical protein